MGEKYIKGFSKPKDNPKFKDVLDSGRKVVRKPVKTTREGKNGVRQIQKV